MSDNDSNEASFHLLPANSAADPDVVVLDLQVPIRDGVALVQHVGETCPRASIIARVQLRSGKSACFRVEAHDGRLRLLRDEPRGTNGNPTHRTTTDSAR